jgi:hypothetical protein
MSADAMIFFIAPPKGATGVQIPGETEKVEQDEIAGGIAVEQLWAADMIVQSHAERPDRIMSRLTNGHPEQLVGSA